MKKYIALSVLTLSLSSCHYFEIHRIDVEQGNHITQAAVQKIHRGMSKSEVTAILGQPLLQNIFTPSRVVYVYTFQEGNAPLVEKRVSIDFENGVVNQIETRY